MKNMPDKLDLEVNKLYFYGLLKPNSHKLYNPYVKLQETGGERGSEILQSRLVRSYVHVHVPEQTQVCAQYMAERSMCTYLWTHRPKD